MDVMKNRKTSLLCRFCYCTPLYQVSFSYLQYWQLYGGPRYYKGPKSPVLIGLKSNDIKNIATHGQEYTSSLLVVMLNCHRNEYKIRWSEHRVSNWQGPERKAHRIHFHFTFKSRKAQTPIRKGSTGSW